jgi:hypothetical protein
MKVSTMIQPERTTAAVESEPVKRDMSRPYDFHPVNVLITCSTVVYLTLFLTTMLLGGYEESKQLLNSTRDFFFQIIDSVLAVITPGRQCGCGEGLSK